MTTPQDHLLDRIKKLPTEIRVLIEKRVELYVIEFGEKLSKNAAKTIASLISLGVFLLAMIFALIALAFFVGDVLDSTAAGFAVVAALLLVLGLVVYLLSPELIESRLRDSIASSFLETNTDSQPPRDSQKLLKDTNSTTNDDDTYSDHSSQHTKPN
jgi:uncharacterized membrane protein YqjE